MTCHISATGVLRPSDLDLEPSCAATVSQPSRFTKQICWRHRFKTGSKFGRELRPLAIIAGPAGKNDVARVVRAALGKRDIVIDGPGPLKVLVTVEAPTLLLFKLSYEVGLSEMTGSVFLRCASSCRPKFDALRVGLHPVASPLLGELLVVLVLALSRSRGLFRVVQPPLGRVGDPFFPIAPVEVCVGRPYLLRILIPIANPSCDHLFRMLLAILAICCPRPFEIGEVPVSCAFLRACPAGVIELPAGLRPELRNERKLPAANVAYAVGWRYVGCFALAPAFSALGGAP